MKNNMKSLPINYASANKQRGVLLIVTMILLLIISGVAAFTIKGSGSSENVANNTRTQALAMQAAEAALRYAETGVLNQNRKDNTKPLGNPAHLFAIAAAPTNLADWTSEAKWDGDTSTSTVVNLFTLDGIASCPTDFSTPASREGNFCGLYKRPPECMAQYANIDNRIVWVTCRGFGPEVVALEPPKNIKVLPSGAEVFLQSVVRLPFP